ncbi:hypothetical protein DFR24_1275 [Panacagrimonas perspica]|uniref:Uncharacterized protein n=1 Tax=Panacagrimonas perspica TaxID=381431 RepID=A0A4R7PE99_9GAMM|nr:hypothetical protein [Panacagrimonas perspica]TDU31891.1 hypothetical protein DFR24_1275 [Panacagrimonas perspica]THD04215.1 hypothetical protein B1810_06145 [Panacagrimonas perspica]
MKTFQTLALIAALATGAFAAPAFAASPNGPSIDGYAAASLSAASAGSVEMLSAPARKGCAIRNTCDLMDPVALDAEFGDDPQAVQQMPESDRP